MSKRVLVVDDEAIIRDVLVGALSDEGYNVSLASSGKEALASIAKDRPDVVLLDIWMPEMDGIETLRQIKLAWNDLAVIVMSGHGNIETAVKATKLGAFDFVEKPLSLERLLVLLQNVTATQDLVRENVAFRQQFQNKHKLLVGESPAMKHIQALIKRVAPTTSSVLITGENGTGKELVSHSIHALSPRFAKPFVEVNCAAIPEELIESELFGHEKGAFTGATQQRRGKFDLANGGTLFLDEIGDMSLKTQAKILRILQEQKFERVGGSQTTTVDVRIVAATNKDLKAEIQRGNFREDLYYRLNVIPFVVPPLRDRREDIPVLARHFVQEFSTLHGRKPREIGPEAMQVLLAYPWPGNVRELKNLMERVVILNPEVDEGQPILASTLLEQLQEEVVSVKALAGPIDQLSHPKNLRDARQEFERDYILRVLKESEGNISRAALVLGIERSHLHKKIKSYGIEI